MVTIRDIPAMNCPACGTVTIDDEAYVEIERLLNLFQNHDVHLPPAKVEIDYKSARRVKRVA